MMIGKIKEEEGETISSSDEGENEEREAPGNDAAT